MYPVTAPSSTSALPLSARMSTKRRTRSADFSKSHSSPARQAAVSSASRDSRSSAESPRRSTTSGCRQGEGCSRAAIAVHAVPVHQRLDRRIVALGFDAHQFGQQLADALLHLADILQQEVRLTVAFHLFDGAGLVHNVVDDQLAVALVVLLNRLALG